MRDVDGACVEPFGAQVRWQWQKAVTLAYIPYIDIPYIMCIYSFIFTASLQHDTEHTL